MIKCFAEPGHEGPAVAQIRSREGERDACLFESRGIGGSQLPVFHIRQRYKSCIVGVIDIHGGGIVEREDERSLGGLHIRNALILVTPGFNDVLHTEFVADPVGPQCIPFVSGLEDLGQTLECVPRLQGDVDTFGSGIVTIPGSIDVGLTKQGDHTHHRTRIALLAASFIERVVSGGFLLQDDEVFFLIGQGHQYPGSAGDAILVMGEYCAESDLPKGFGPGFVHIEHLHPFDICPNGLVPSKCSFLIGVELGWCVPVECGHAPLGHVDAIVGVEIYERRVDELPLAIHHDSVGRDGHLAANGGNTTLLHQQSGVLEGRLAIAHDRGMCKGVSDVALIGNTVQRERRLRHYPNGQQQSP